MTAPERLVAGVFSLWRGLLQWWGESCRRAAQVTQQAKTQQVRDIVVQHCKLSFYYDASYKIGTSRLLS